MTTSVLSRKLAAELRRIVGRDALLTEPGELIPYESDALTAHRATPAAVAFVHDTAELQRVVAALHAARIPFVPRGAGTGLSGGALADGAVIIELSRMNRILWIDAENRRARVQPGVVNTELGAALAPCGLMYAPDPSSQTACTLGGNVAENSGGPHCLKYGVTANHILALSVVMPDGELVELAGPAAAGYDLVGLFVGSEGTLGICSEIELRLVPSPAAVETLLAHFDAMAEAGQAVSAIIAAGILPAALEMIDRETLKAVEASVYAAGFPTDVAASLIVELDGPRAGLAEQAAEVDALLGTHGARQVARARDEEDRMRFWRARKSAFGAMGRIGTDLLVQDATVPRSRLPDVLARVYEIARKYDLVITNVFHAGDGNLHPNIPFDRRDTGLTQRVHTASREIMEACVAAGGTITGEHGVGIDKRDYMPLIYSADDRRTMRWVKEVFDPAGLCNPGKILPRDLEEGEPGEREKPYPAPSARAAPGAARPSVAARIESALGRACLLEAPQDFVIDDRPADVAAAPGSVEELAELMRLASAAGWAVVPAGAGGWLDVGNPLPRADLVVTTRRLDSEVEHHPEDLLATVRAGTRVGELNAALARSGQWWPLDPLGDGSLGAIIATGCSGPLAPAYGSPRDLVLGLTVVLADGRIVRAGGRVVKNVAGYDMVKLYTGSWGTLGVIAEAHLRLYARPKADVTRIYRGGCAEAVTALARELARGDRLAPAAAEILSPAAAAALGLETDECILALRWLGHPRAVEDAVDAAESLTARAHTGLTGASGVGGAVMPDDGARLWDELTGLERRLKTALTLRAEVQPAATAEFVRLLQDWADRAGRAFVAGPLQGRIWILVPAPRYEEEPSAGTWAPRLTALRRIAGECGGGLRVERAPLELRRLLDPWGDGGGAIRLSRELKRRFDPTGVLKPGFFAGEL